MLPKDFMIGWLNLEEVRQVENLTLVDYPLAAPAASPRLAGVLINLGAGYGRRIDRWCRGFLRRLLFRRPTDSDQEAR